MATIRERVLAGEQVLGAMVFECFTPGIARLMELAGCDYVLYDMEHTGIGLETLRVQAAHCRGLSVAPMARVPRCEYRFIAGALDIGMKGVMVPMVESADQARVIGEASRYPPGGRRGAAFGFAHDDYAPGDPAEKMRRADAEVLTIAQIETERGLENLDAIAATDGIDVLWLGHFDLTNFLGVPGQFRSQTYLDAVRAIVGAARRHGKGLGFMAADAGWLREYRDHGFNMLAAGPDQAMLVQGVRGVLAAADEDRA
jgi:2-dehydro-3-deoxyglucarate aldolase/4-hydroxy-2-oxoheptanedioate aldolase